MREPAQLLGPLFPLAMPLFIPWPSDDMFSQFRSPLDLIIMSPVLFLSLWLPRDTFSPSHGASQDLPCAPHPFCSTLGEAIFEL